MSLPEIRRRIETEEALRAAQEKRAGVLLERRKLVVLEEANRILYANPIFTNLAEIAANEEALSALKDIWDGWNVEIEIPAKSVPRTIPILGEIGKKVIPARKEKVAFKPEFNLPKIGLEDISDELVAKGEGNFSKEDLEKIVEGVLERPTLFVRLRGNTHHIHEKRADFDAGNLPVARELSLTAYADRPAPNQELRLEIAINDKYAVHSLDELLHSLADLSRKGQHPSGEDMLYEKCLNCDGVDSYLSRYGFTGLDDYTKERILQLKKEKELG